MNKRYTDSYKYLAKNTVLFTISSFGSKFLTFFLTLLYTRCLTPSEYGTGDIINTTAILCIYVLTITISHSVMRFSIENVERSDLVLRFGFKVLIIGTSVLTFGTVIVRSLHVIQWEDYCYGFLILIFFSHALEEMLGYYLRAIDKIRIMVVSSLISTGVKLVTSFVLLYFFNYGLIGYLISLVIGPICSVIISFCSIAPLKHSTATKAEIQLLQSDMIRYAIPSAINAVGWWIAGNIDRYYLVAMEGAAINGIYSVAYKIPAIVGTVTNIFSQAWNLSAIKEYDKETKKDNTGFFSKMYGLLTAIAFVLCSVIILFNIPIARVLFAKEFFEAWIYSPILLLGTVFNCIAVFFGGIFSAAKHNSELAYSMIISMLTNILLNSILIPKFSAFGAAIATFISYYIVFITRFIFSKRYLHFQTHMLGVHIVLVLLCIQIYFALRPSHYYFGQLVIIAILFIIYRNEFFFLFRKGIDMLKK